MPDGKPNILVIWGDDIGITNLSCYSDGLMAGGQAGVARAIEILEGQLTRTMRLLGVTCLEELGPGHVTQLDRLPG